MNRQEILASVRTNIQDTSTRRHILATEAIMRAFANRLGQNEEEWGLTALLHDIDVELVEGDTSTHSKLAADIARELGATDAMAHAILCHNQVHGLPRESPLDRALFCADGLSRLITAATPHDPAKLEELTTEVLLKRFREQGFAPEVDREQVAECGALGLELDEAMALGIEALAHLHSYWQE